MMNRREALTRISGLFALGVFGGTKAVAESAKPAAPAGALSATGESFSIAHITDVHLFDKLESEKWFAKSLHALQSHPKKPQLILNTGDCVMDTCRIERDQASALWKVWQNSLKQECSLPVHTCMGNHDFWGTNHKENSRLRKDPMYGQKLGMDGIGLDKPYYSFDHAGWHFVMLDSISPKKQGGWMSMLGKEQMEWLEKDLAATKKPVLVNSHVPILQVIWMRGTAPNDHYEYTASNFHMVAEARELINLFARSGKVKLCFSGHIHQLDRVELDGVTYICDGAVSGNKWRGPVREVENGYSITTLHPDGKFDHEYLNYGWKKA